MSIFFLALHKGHGRTCKGAFRLTAGPCPIAEQAKAKEALGSVTNSGVVGEFLTVFTVARNLKSIHADLNGKNVSLCNSKESEI